MKPRNRHRLAEIFKALSDPTRLRLVKLLNEHGGTLCVNALAHRLDVSQSAISQHLRVLRQVWLVGGVRHGYHVHYALDAGRLEQYLQDLQNEAQAVTECLAALRGED